MIFVFSCILDTQESKSNSDLELVDIVVDRSPSKMKHHFGRRRPSDQKNEGKSKIYREISSTILIDTDWLTFGKKIGNGAFYQHFNYTLYY